MLFTVFAIATWRLTRMLQKEEGPFNIFGKFRNLFIKNEEGGTRLILIGKLLACMWCLSVWVAMPFAFHLASNLLELVAYTAALSGAAMLIQYLQEKLEQ